MDKNALLITIYIEENKLICVPPKSLVNNQEASLKTMKTNKSKQKLSLYYAETIDIWRKAFSCTRHNEIVDESFVSKNVLEKFKNVTYCLLLNKNR